MSKNYLTPCHSERSEESQVLDPSLLLRMTRNTKYE